MNVDQGYKGLPAGLALPVVTETAASPELLAWNADLADELGLAHLGEDAERCARIFSGGPLPDELVPRALAYAGHQFGVFVPQLGDGRAALLGEVVARDGRRFDVQLKGSGRTPFSRGGDGRSWLGPVIREYVVSEAMHHLGVPTTRALAAVATGQTVYRETGLPGAVFTRIAASHLRIGTFEYLAAHNDREGIRALADHAIARHYPEARDSDLPCVEFLRVVVARQAELIARWMAVGFVHGVMNTDNMSIAGETLDYGPCAFMDEFRFDKVFSSIDLRGRYCYANQPKIALWNLARLAECLLHLTDERDAIEAALDEFPSRYETAWRSRMGAKLGLLDPAPEDDALINEWLQHLQDNELDFTLSFRELGLRLVADDAPRFGDFEPKWLRRVGKGERDAGEILQAMNAANPVFIPRNHRIEQAIRAALDGDITMFRELNAVLRRPFTEQPEFDRYADAPSPDERVTTTFCGT